MHVEIVLTLEVASANGTNVGGCGKRSFVDALDATRTPFPFLPLIVAEVATVKVGATPATIPGCHDGKSFFVGLTTRDVDFSLNNLWREHRRISA